MSIHEGQKKTLQHVHSTGLFFIFKIYIPYTSTTATTNRNITKIKKVINTNTSAMVP